MVIGKSIVNRHVFKVTADMGFEELFNLVEVEFRIHKDGAKVGFDDVGQALGRKISVQTGVDLTGITFGGIFTVVQ